jgi:hypothetical protein
MALRNETDCWNNVTQTRQLVGAATMLGVLVLWTKRRTAPACLGQGGGGCAKAVRFGSHTIPRQGGRCRTTSHRARRGQSATPLNRGLGGLNLRLVGFLPGQRLDASAQSIQGVRVARNGLHSDHGRFRPILRRIYRSFGPNLTPRIEVPRAPWEQSNCRISLESSSLFCRSRLCRKLPTFCK